MNVAKHPGMLAIESALVDAGFKRRRAGLLTKELGEEVLGWVGLNTSGTAATAGVVLVNPVIGVRHQVLERAVAEIKGEKFHPYLPPSYTSPLSAIAAHVGANDFILHDNSGDPEVIHRLVNSVTSNGTSFMNEYADPTRLLAQLGSEYLHNHTASLRYPTLLWLTGDRAGAGKAIADGLADAGQRRGPAARELKAYLTELTRRIEAQG